MPRVVLDYEPMSLKLPCVLGGRYECRERIGAGGMGEVYLARHMGLERDVAVKVLSLHGVHAGQEERIKERFRREAVALSRLRHPNTVQVVDFGWTDDRRPYIVTELLKGRTLDITLQHEGPFDSPRTLHIIVQLARSLAEAHQHGIVHRDLKPSNVFLMEAFGTHDYVKLIDFGVARIDEADEEARARPLTVEGTTLGTPDYMAPEQARGHKPAPATDVYALGCMMFEMLTGEPPFTGDSALQVMIKHIKQAPPTLGNTRPSLEQPPGLEHLVMACMRKDLLDRPETAAVVVDLIEEIQNGKVEPRLREASFSELDAVLDDGPTEVTTGGGDEATPGSPLTPSPGRNFFGGAGDTPEAVRSDRSGLHRVKQRPGGGSSGGAYRKPLALKRGRGKTGTKGSPIPGRNRPPSEPEPLVAPLNEDLLATQEEDSTESLAAARGHAQRTKTAVLPENALKPSHQMATRLEIAPLAEDDVQQTLLDGKPVNAETLAEYTEANDKSDLIVTTVDGREQPSRDDREDSEGRNPWLIGLVAVAGLAAIATGVWALVHYVF